MLNVEPKKHETFTKTNITQMISEVGKVLLDSIQKFKHKRKEWLDFIKIKYISSSKDIFKKMKMLIRHKIFEMHILNKAFFLKYVKNTYKINKTISSIKMGKIFE